MAFTPFAGSAGRLKSVAVTPSLSVPTPTLTGLSTTVTAGIDGWELSQTTEDGGPLYHYEGDATTAGVIAPVRLQGGLGNSVVTARGFYDGDTTSTDERFVNGAFVVMDLIFSRASTYGRYGVPGKIMSYKETEDIKANAIRFEVTVEIHGTPAAPTVPPPPPP